MKLVYVLLDGVGDRLDPSFSANTPLESAKTPNLDLLCRHARMGLVQTVGKGIAPESDIAVFSMLGYRFGENYCGRGVVEAVGSGLKFYNGELALRANFATLNGDQIVDRRAGRDLSDNEAGELAKAIQREVELSSSDASFSFLHTVAHRAVLVIRRKGVNLSSNISNTDSGYSKVGGMGVVRENGGHLKLEESKPLDGREESKISAGLVNEFTKKAVRVLESHSINVGRRSKGQKAANGILLRDAGNKLPDIRTLNDRFGVTFSSIVDMPVEKGIARITGMKIVESTRRDSYAEKVKKVGAALKNSNVLYVHINGPDEPGHDGECEAKKRVIEQIDEEFFGSLEDIRKPMNVSIAVSADHSTPCLLKSHSSDPVPLMIYRAEEEFELQEGARFTESSAARGSLGLLEGPDVLPKVFSLVHISHC
jgi:2,3-bisphosphoglycerate-independent phosphoglycerate mutase